MVDQQNWMHTLGLVASIILPFFNVPLMFRMIQRRSSADMSLVWAIGVWICILAMAPAAWHSPDPVFRIFSVTNLTFFTGVVFLIVYFRISKKNASP